MSTRLTASTIAIAVAMALGFAAPSIAQTARSIGPEGSTQSGVRTPSSGGDEVSPRPGALPGRSTTSAMPAERPSTVNEAGEARLDEKTTRAVPPAGSAAVPSPQTPLSVKEAGDPRPLQRRDEAAGTAVDRTGQPGVVGGTAGAAAAGSADAEVKTPFSVKEAGDPRPVQRRQGTAPGAETTAVPPRDVPSQVQEAGDPRPAERTTQTPSPAGSASLPNPQTPPTVKEAGDARPMDRGQGTTPGAAGAGTTPAR